MKHILFAVVLAALARSVVASKLPDALVGEIRGISGVQHESAKSLKTDVANRTATGESLFTLRAAVPPDLECCEPTQARNCGRAPDEALDAAAASTLGGLCAKAERSAVCVVRRRS